MPISLKLASLFVDDQEKALSFYTEKLGFVKKKDKPAGPHRWLTVGAETSEFELVLEPNVQDAAKAYQKSIFEAGIPATMLFVDDMDAEFKRLKDSGVEFEGEIIKYEGNRLAKFNDTCGNWIMLVEEM